MELLLLILIALAVFLVSIIVYYFNRFSILQNRIENSFSQIDVQLRKRADLVPNLVESVKGYAKHEKSIMSEVSAARKALVGARDISSKIKAGDQLQRAISGIFAIAENYPQLKANENFLQLQEELSAIEDKVAYSRQFYNDSILDYNLLFSTFPGNMFASIFNKQKQTYLSIPEASRAVPKVSF